jgi:transposase
LRCACSEGRPYYKHSGDLQHRATCLRHCSRKKAASHLGLIPREHNSGGRQHLGLITEDGNIPTRMLLVEAAQIAVRCDPGMPSEYLPHCHREAMVLDRREMGQ